MARIVNQRRKQSRLVRCNHAYACGLCKISLVAREMIAEGETPSRRYIDPRSYATDKISGHQLESGHYVGSSSASAFYGALCCSNVSSCALLLQDWSVLFGLPLQTRPPSRSLPALPSVSFPAAPGACSLETAVPPPSDSRARSTVWARRRFSVENVLG